LLSCLTLVSESAIAGEPRNLARGVGTDSAGDVWVMSAYNAVALHDTHELVAHKYAGG
jgi:hypothetical protein